MAEQPKTKREKFLCKRCGWEFNRVTHRWSAYSQEWKPVLYPPTQCSACRALGRAEAKWEEASGFLLKAIRSYKERWPKGTPEYERILESSGFYKVMRTAAQHGLGPAKKN